MCISLFELSLQPSTNHSLSPHLSHFAHLSRKGERVWERRMRSGMITAVKNFNQKEIRLLSTTMERGLWGETFFRNQSNKKLNSLFIKLSKAFEQWIYQVMHMLSGVHIGICNNAVTGHSRQHTDDNTSYGFSPSLCDHESPAPCCGIHSCYAFRLPCCITVTSKHGRTSLRKHEQ